MSSNRPTAYRKKPLVILAMGPLTDGNAAQIADWCDGTIGKYSGHVHIGTLEGTMTAQHGDYVIRGVAGEHYPCKPDIFEGSYEPTVTDADGRVR